MMNRNNNELIKYIEHEQERFYRLAYSYTRSREDALDVVQNAIVKALAADDMRNPEYYRTWMYRIVVNCALDLLRRRKVIISYEDYFTDKSTGDAISKLSISMDLKKAIGALPPDLRTIIILRFFEDCKLSEIAEITNFNINTVKTKLYRALDILKIDMEEEQA